MVSNGWERIPKASRVTHEPQMPTFTGGHATRERECRRRSSPCRLLTAVGGDRQAAGHGRRVRPPTREATTQPPRHDDRRPASPGAPGRSVLPSLWVEAAAVATGYVLYQVVQVVVAGSR